MKPTVRHSASCHVRAPLLAAGLVLLLAGCGGNGSPTAAGFQATAFPTATGTPVASATPLASPTPTQTPTPTLSPAPAATDTPAYTSTPSATPTITPTPGLLTPTPPAADGAPPAVDIPPAGESAGDGWSCGDFPCADDIDGFLQRIQAPPGFAVEHVGRLPGQPMQIVYGPDGLLYATVITDGGTREGAVYVLDPDGTARRYSDTLIAPIGLVFRPGTQTLYVSARVTLTEGGGIWQVDMDGTTALAVDGLPCCYNEIDNQPNGMIFGPDGYLYLGVGALTDHREPENPQFEQYAQLDPLEATILRINPLTNEKTVYARGVRNGFDLALDASGRMWCTDSGLVTGPGDRLLQIIDGAHYGWPFWGDRGCTDCPPPNEFLNVVADFITFPDYSLPRGIVAYTGAQFPANLFNNLFVVLWNDTEGGQRVVRIDPATVPEEPLLREGFEPVPFMTGLIRPIDVTVAPDGTMVVADFIYGHVWRVRYVPGSAPAVFATNTPQP
jgi:hypothetical protein